MKHEKDPLSAATDALANTDIPPGPPQEVVDATLTKLAAAIGEPVEPTVRSLKTARRIRITPDLIKFAAAAVVLIAAGYLVGRLLAPKPMDAAELYAALKPAIQQDLLEPMGRQWQLILASNNADLKDQMQADFRQEMNEFAVRTLTASGALTNQYLKDLVQSINASQMQNRRWLAAALQQIELDRIRDKAQLANGLESLAVATGDELQRTKDDIVQLLAYNQPTGLSPNIYENPNTPK
jgi:hypothetical protein